MTIVIRVRESTEEVKFRTEANSVAALILEVAGAEESVIWEDDLRRFMIDDQGIVRERTERSNVDDHPE